MNMVEGTALVFLKLGAVAAVIIVVIMFGCRWLEKRGREKSAKESGDQP